ncbi:MAG: 2-oxo acid dehydrogenase subunit E2 [Elusimicrobia bacterium]|nr:2-oxo acid dehydrogenase subunit E2 [Elusimicrobiota bacterium]
MFEFKLPDVGEGLHEGEIVQWYVKEGDAVIQDQHLVDVLTDKATVEITSPKAGKILKLAAKPGDKVKIGEVIVVIGQEGEVLEGARGRGGEGANKATASSVIANPAEGGVKQSHTSATSFVGEILATPAVRKLAKDLGVDLAGLRGTGSGGRITEDDLRGASGKIQHPASSIQHPAHGPETRVPFVGIRRKTAEKMSLSQKTAAHVTHIDEADVTELVALREKMKPVFEKEGIKLTYLSFVVKAVAAALKEFPYLNAVLDEPKQEIVLKSYYNLSIAMDTEKGLVTPVLKDCDKKDLKEIARELSLLVDKALAGKLEPAELQGGTFTITNIGPIGGLAATPIVNYPETGILGVMKIAKRPAVKNGQIAVRDLMNLCLSFDHRVLDGAYAARFTTALIKRLENPAAL